MSIDQTDKIDFIGTSRDEKVILTISDHLEWDDAGEHILLLQEKVNAYLQFIEGGQIYEDYPKASASELIISVKLQFKPNKLGLEFLNRCKTIILDTGIGFEWDILESTD
jgi:hypothetical protein